MVRARLDSCLWSRILNGRTFKILSNSETPWLSSDNHTISCGCQVTCLLIFLPVIHNKGKNYHFFSNAMTNWYHSAKLAITVPNIIPSYIIHSHYKDALTFFKGMKIKFTWCMARNVHNSFLFICLPASTIIRQRLQSAIAYNVIVM